MNECYSGRTAGGSREVYDRYHPTLTDILSHTTGQPTIWEVLP